MSKVERNKTIRIPPRLIREGTVGDCPKCGSTTVQRFIFFGISIGCINDGCDNFYKTK